MWRYVSLSCLLVSLPVTTGLPDIGRIKRQTQTIGSSSIGDINIQGSSSGNVIGPVNSIGPGLEWINSTFDCALPEQPTGGRFRLTNCRAQCSNVTGNNVPTGSILYYECEKGNSLRGNTISVCVNNEWTEPPFCEISCPALESKRMDVTCTYQGSKVPCGSMAPGGRATVTCKESYKHSLPSEPANKELICLEEGIWDQSPSRCFPECGTMNVEVFPWHVGIYTKDPAQVYDYLCAGTLVSSNIVISAAHCFYSESRRALHDVSRFAVAAGKHFRSWNVNEAFAQKSDITKIEVPENYIGANGNYAKDISIVFLKTPFTMTTQVTPICIDWENIQEGGQLHNHQNGKTVGWSETREGMPSNELQEKELSVVSYSECESAVPRLFHRFLTTDKFCARYSNGSSICSSDTGGGLYFQQNGLWYLRGIVSLNLVRENSCDNSYYTTFTDIGIFRDWITDAYISS